MIIPEVWVKRAREFATGSLAVSQEKRVSKEVVAVTAFVGRLGELGVALDLGLDPEFDLNWSFVADQGPDLVFREKRIDVKASSHYLPCLIWPVTKRKDWPSAQFDVLALVEVHAPEVIVHGYVWKDFFFRQKQVSTGEVLSKGTWFMTCQDVQKIGGDFWSKETLVHD